MHSGISQKRCFDQCANLGARLDIVPYRTLGYGARTIRQCWRGRRVSGRCYHLTNAFESFSMNVISFALGAAESGSGTYSLNSICGESELGAVSL